MHRTAKMFAQRAERPRIAAPAGGAPQGGRGCLILWAFLGSAVPLAAEEIRVPSGQPITFDEMVQETSGYGLSYHFRFVAPQIGPDGFGYMDVVDDFEALCNDYAFPRIASIGPQPAQVIIALASEKTEFGIASEEVTQFFEAFSLSDGRCIWKAF